MWGSKSRTPGKTRAEEADSKPQPLKDAVRRARIETAERSGVVVDMRDAEAARLELLNDALDPVFSEIPAGVELFDRGVSKGDIPRLWIDIVAYVVMGRDKRLYRFVQDTRYGRKVLLESNDIPEMTRAVTRYIAGRLVERERALSNGTMPGGQNARRAGAEKRRRTWRGVVAFLFGVVVGIAALVIAALWQVK